MRTAWHPPRAVRRSWQSPQVKWEGVAQAHHRVVAQLAWIFVRKLPPSSMYEFQDLLQEGLLRIPPVLRAFKPDRGVLLSTYLATAIRFRYQALLSQEWRRAHGRAGMAEAVKVAAAGPDQEAVDALVDLERGLPDRYGRLLPTAVEEIPLVHPLDQSHDTIKVKRTKQFTLKRPHADPKRPHADPMLAPAVSG